MPTGWPSAIAPPLTFTMSASTPSARIDTTPTAAKASFISSRSRSETVMPSRAQAFLIAFAGCSCSEASGPATTPWDPITASGVRPSSSAFRRLMTTTAAAPSEICDELPAVMVPSLANAGRSLPRPSAVVSARMPSSSVTMMGSPLRWGTATGAISAANTPDSWARAAR